MARQALVILLVRPHVRNADAFLRPLSLPPQDLSCGSQAGRRDGTGARLSFCLLLSAGVRSWEDVDPAVCSLDEQLKAFVSRHSATFSSIVKGDLPHSASLGSSAAHWMPSC